MTSAVSRSDVEEALWRISGRASWAEIEKVLRIIDGYAVTMGRKLGSGPPPVRPRRTGEYLCKKCRQRQPLDNFPEPKRRNPILSYHCLRCQG